MSTRRFVCWVLAVALGEVLGLYVVDVFGQERKVTLEGRLWATPDQECAWFTDPIGESLSIELKTLPESYLCDYLKGSEGSDVIITIGPKPK